MDPDDLSTNWGALLHPTIGVTGGGPGVTALPPGWPPALELSVYPSLAPIAVREFSDGGPAEELAPRAPLTDGWYVFRVHGWSGGFAGVDPVQRGKRGPVQLSNGDYGVRFRVGSHPLVLVAALCASQSLDLLPKVLLRFSEPVKASGSVLVRVVLNGGDAACSQNVDTASPTDFIELSCNPPIPAAAPARVELSSGLVSASGVPVRDATGATSISLPVPIAENDVGCRAWIEKQAPTEGAPRDAGSKD